MLFIFLELMSIILIINSHNYAQTKVHSLKTEISGKINRRLSFIEERINLLKHNKELEEQNTRLLNTIHNPLKNEAINLPGQYEFIPGFVISNQYSFSHNNILINRGRKDGVEPEMGVIGTNGIVGIVQKTSKNYAKVLSVLNTDTKINVALKDTNYTGFLVWEGNNPNNFSVIDMPVNAHIKIGDTITTSGVSNIFPKGINIGKIINYKTVAGRKSYKINLISFMDMTGIGPVYIVKNNYKKEIDSLLEIK